MSDRFAEILANGPVVTDGSWGTQLQARGLTPGMAPRRLEHPAARHPWRPWRPAMRKRAAGSF